MNGASAMHYTANTERELATTLKLRSNSVVIPNGLDVDEFETLPPRGDFRRRSGVASQTRVVLFLGRLHPKKGLEILIHGFAKAALSDTLLVIAGPDSSNYKVQLTALVDSLQIREKVIFAGMLNGRERIEALVDADVLALTSYQENFGIVVIEALACGTPVIVSDQVNIWRDMMASGACRVARLSVEDTARVLGEWAEQHSTDAQRSTRARQWALNTFDWTTIAQQWHALYTNIQVPHS